MIGAVGLISFFQTENLAAQPLVNPKATIQAQKLKLFLDSIQGKQIISGQAFEDVNENWLTIISNASGGKQPAIMSLDFMNSSPLRISMGTNPDATTDKAIDWVKNKGGLLEMHWHWDAPSKVTGDKWQAFYTKNTAFDVAAAMNDMNSDDYKLLVRDIDFISERLLRLQKEGIAVLWRPLHEAEGGWFWWGAKTGDACKKLYRMMYDRMVNYHGINNLIWVWNSYGKTKENWYPGDDVVDIIAWDYPDYNQTSGSWSQYQQMFGSKGKMFGIGEDGKLTDPKVMSTQGWLYFLTWAYMVQDPSQKDGKNPKDWLKQVYNDPRVITLDDLIPGPKASSGPSQLIFDADGNGTEKIVLDGSASITDEGTITSYTWTENGNQIATGVNPEVMLALGVHTIVLKITTSTNATKSSQVVITIKTPTISLKKSVTVSSTEANLGNLAVNANDGDPATRWSSIYSDPQWYQIDLGKKYDISKVIIFWEAASAKKYTIDISDDGSIWTTIQAKSNMPSGARTDELNGLTGSGRYIRMNGIERTTNYGYSIFEFEVYGNESGATGLINPEENEFRLYPNLVRKSGELLITCSEGLLPANYQIFSQTGLIKKQGILSEEQNSFAIDDSFHCGIYIFRLQHQDFFQSLKFSVVN